MPSWVPVHAVCCSSVAGGRWPFQAPTVPTGLSHPTPLTVRIGTGMCAGSGGWRGRTQDLALAWVLSTPSSRTPVLSCGPCLWIWGPRSVFFRTAASLCPRPHLSFPFCSCPSASSCGQEPRVSGYQWQLRGQYPPPWATPTLPGYSELCWSHVDVCPLGTKTGCPGLPLGQVISPASVFTL